MKNYLLLLLLLSVLFSCRSEPKNESGAETAAMEQPATQPQSTGPQQAPAPEASVQKKEEEPVVGARPAFVPPMSEDVLTITAQNARVKPGADVCVAFRAKGFTNLLAMQYTMAWDPKVLEFKGVDKPGLPYLDQADFGFNRTKEGRLPFVWINDALQPTTIPDESIIYMACFNAIGTSGQSSAIRFVEQPTPFEVVNANEEIQKLNPVEGKVEIE
ncbi:MAG: hypothetical protein KDD06_10470 [Phaeodactylibacter sp.]|nr:hypothetical protein [Phaeodactylibacter sp.]MCB9267452.1 hypothetical protein [Lewinellaceae bacterium]MCB9288755.1 hypothetical protein [Lewinellaceae bacterium]